MRLDIVIVGFYFSFRVDKYFYFIPKYYRHPLDWESVAGNKDLYCIRWLIFEFIYRDYQQREWNDLRIVIN